MGLAEDGKLNALTRRIQGDREEEHCLREEREERCTEETVVRMPAIAISFRT